MLFIEFRVFTEGLHRLAKRAEDVLFAIQEDLLRNPERGSVVPGLGGIRKARVENPVRGKGKRGGFRYMYYFLERDEGDLSHVPVPQGGAGGLEPASESGFETSGGNLEGRVR